MMMKSHVSSIPSSTLTLRKVLKFNTILGITLPKEFVFALDLKHQDYVELSLGANKTIVVSKHGASNPTRFIYGSKQ